MIVNGEKYNLKDLVNSINFNDNQLINVSDKLELTRYQIDVLTKWKIPYQNSNLNDIIYELEQAYEECDDEELEIVLDELSERNYYQNTNK